MSYKILIVDDNSINRKLLTVMLKTKDYTIKEAEDGIVALKILESEKIDLIISDILMPNLDGYGLCRKIRVDPNLQKIPFIIFSRASFSKADEQFALNVGADFLKSPTTVEILVGKIEKYRNDPSIHLSSPSAVFEDSIFLKQYNEVLINELENKNFELSAHLTKLSESEENFRDLVENIKEVFYITGPSGWPMRYISPAYETIWGRTRESLYEDPMSWMNNIVEEDRAAVAESIKNNNATLEYRIHHADGSLRYIKAKSTIMLDDQGKPLKLIGIAEDITEFKLLHAQLLQSQKMEAIGLLAGGIAHDFNNILAVMALYIDLAIQNVNDANNGTKIEASLKKILSAQDRAVALTRRLLTFSHKQVIEPKIVSLNEIIRGLYEMIRRVVDARIDLETKFAKDVDSIFFDVSQMEQILVNLVVNARDAISNEGKITIQTSNIHLKESDLLLIKNRSEIEAGDYVNLTVNDTGCGMNATTIEKIFEPFFTTKEVGKGTGLGLSIVYSIILQNKGAISVKSQEGKGSSFQIYFPSRKEKSETAPLQRKDLKTLTGTETILLTEDDAALREILASELRVMGYTVYEARNGEEALGILKERMSQIDFLVSDVIMPKMGGGQLVKHARAINAELKVLFISGYTDDASIMEEIDMHTTQFIGKPFHLQDLLEKIREMLEYEIA